MSQAKHEHYNDLVQLQGYQVQAPTIQTMTTERVQEHTGGSWFSPFLAD